MVLKKIYLESLEKLFNLYKKDRYVSNPFYILFCGYSNKRYSGIFLRDEIYANEFPFLGLPKNKREWKNAIRGLISEEELSILKRKSIKIEKTVEIKEEFYYSTKNLIELKGKDFHDFRKAINRFRKRYKFKVMYDYPKEKILRFMDNWAKNQKEKTKMFESARKYAKFCVIVKDKFPNANWIFIEIDKKLVGYCCSIRLSNLLWVGVHQKVDYNYVGLSRFLIYERIKQFVDVPFFTLGSGVDGGITQFKESLRPIKKARRYFRVTGDNEE